MRHLRGTLAAEAIDGRLLLAELALDRDDRIAARSQLDDLGELDWVGAVDQVAIAAVRARLERLDGDPVAALTACRHGVEGLARLRSSTGALDLQAHVGAHASTLTDEGVAAAIAAGDVEQVLEWVEWRRGVALAVPPVRAADDWQLASDISNLRHLEWSAHADSVERDRLQARIADRARRVGGRSWVVDPTDVHRLHHGLGGRVLLHLFSDGPVLRAIRTKAGESTVLYEIGDESDIRREGLLLASALRRALRRPITDQVVTRLQREARLLDGHTALLLADSDPNEGVVLCPPPGLAGVPWGLLPSLADRNLVIAPTARVLGRTPGTAQSGVVLVTNGLRHAEGEVAALAALHPHATVLGGDDATCERVLEAIAGAAIAHFACHGSFNPENPLFSSLQLADGPLYGYDLASVRAAPAIVTMAACQTAETSDAGLEDVLGLSTVLLAHGTVGVLAAQPDVPDSADTAAVSLMVHEALARGHSLASGLRAARQVYPLVAAAFQVMGDDAVVNVGTSRTRSSSRRG